MDLLAIISCSETAPLDSSKATPPERPRARLPARGSPGLCRHPSHSINEIVKVSLENYGHLSVLNKKN